MTKETTPSQRALDHASQLARFKNWDAVPCDDLDLQSSICNHARTLDQLWVNVPELAPKTKGELFAEELRRRWNGDFSGNPVDCASRHATQMIDENWGEEA